MVPYGGSPDFRLGVGRIAKQDPAGRNAAKYHTVPPAIFSHRAKSKVHLGRYHIFPSQSPERLSRGYGWMLNATKSLQTIKNYGAIIPKSERFQHLKPKDSDRPRRSPSPHPIPLSPISHKASHERSAMTPVIPSQLVSILVIFDQVFALLQAHPAGRLSLST